MSKTIDKYIKANPEKFESWHTEMDGYGEDYNSHLPSYWIYCKAPYFNPRTDTQTIHVKTVKEALAEMRDVEVGKYNGYCWESV